MKHLIISSEKIRRLTISLEKKTLFFSEEMMRLLGLLPQSCLCYFCSEQMQCPTIPSEKMELIIISSEKNEAPLYFSHYLFRKNAFFFWRNNKKVHFFLKK
jgi:hypothetical protein